MAEIQKMWRHFKIIGCRFPNRRRRSATMKFEIDTDKIIDNVVSEALEREIDGKTIKQWMVEIAKHQWISVKENLPKVSGHYLVSCVANKTGHRWEVPVNAEWLTSRREWYIETENCLASAAGVTVTHYMPPPELPKEDKP